jgi:solute:Na+ symporter, SSS family
MIIVALYFFLIAIFTWVNRSDFAQNVFKVKGKVSWWLSGLSLYMIYLTSDQGQLLTGILAAQGMQGMWLIWSQLFGIFVIPIVFAPLWNKLDLITDNQFLLLRYPGKSGQILHGFRAVYVGLIVVSLIVCFQVLGFGRVISVYFDVPHTQAIFGCGLVICVFALKNVLNLKFKTDGFHYVIFLVAFAVGFFYVYETSGGWAAVQDYFEKQPSKRLLLPAVGADGAWFSFFVFTGIQWWSCQIFDGGGPEMSRYTATKDTKSAAWAGLLSVGLLLFFSTILIMQILMILGSSEVTTGNQELIYVTEIFKRVPEVYKGLLLVGFFGMFITTVEALNHWGAGFLTVDLYQKYLDKTASEKRVKFFSFLFMLLLALLSSVFAFYIESLQSLVKITFSIAAGVAPVYILRWVWYRINAWSQLSAMISSGIFTMLYSNWHIYLPLRGFPLEESRIVFVTIATTALWLLVTFLTPDQSKEVAAVLDPVIGKKRNFIKRFVIALLLGVSIVAIVAAFWSRVLDVF